MKNAPAPTEEAKQTARQLRDVLKEAIENAIDNDWDELCEHLRIAESLTEHLRKAEETQKRHEATAVAVATPVDRRAGGGCDPGCGGGGCGGKGECAK